VIHYCTYFDDNYVVRAIAMLASLRRHSAPFTLWCLSLTPECEAILKRLALPEIRIVPLRELEAADADLVATKSGRTRAEYFFTITPCWCRHLLSRHPEIDLLTYLDSDLIFYANPAPLFQELGSASIGIIEHRTTRPRVLERKFGRFNVGWVSFRNDATAEACVADWRRDCLEWCFDHVEPGRYADQKYLDRWPERHAGLKILTHPGANVAPWNVARHDVRLSNGRLTSDAMPLIFYHFHGLRNRRNGLVDLALAQYKVPLSTRRWLRQHLYRPYLMALHEHSSRVNPGHDISRVLQTARQDEGTSPSLAYVVGAEIASKTVTVWAPLHRWWMDWSGSGITGGWPSARIDDPAVADVPLPPS
jgi:hypothetical protein